MKISSNELKYLSKRSQSLCGNILVKENGVYVSKPLGATVSKFFDELLTSDTPEMNAQRAEFLAKAARDPKARQQLAAIRIETFNNFIYASNNFWEFFFETVNLKPDERPAEQNTTNEELKVYFVGGDGSPQTKLIARNDQEDLKVLDFLTTDWARYEKMDVYRGSVADAALATIDLAYDWRNQADGQCYTLVSSASVFGTFVFSGKKQNYPYVTNSRINTTNLPTTNDIDITNATPVYFGFPVFDEIIDYFGRWAGVDAKVSAKPTGRILVPGSDIRQIKRSLTATGAKVNEVGENILADGWFGVHYLGKDWTMIPDNTLTPGTCYPESTVKPGRVYLKPDLDQELEDTDPKLIDKNYGRRKVKKVFGASLNAANRRLLCRVKYNTP